MQTPGMWAFIGIDPGVTSGIAWGTCKQFIGRQYWETHAASADPDAMLFILRRLLAEFNAMHIPVLVQGEKFITSRKPGTGGKDADLTRRYLISAQSVSKEFDATFVQQPAGAVKPWATDKRLEAVGFPLAPKLRDARDAGRHMLFAAVKSGRVNDPLLLQANVRRVQREYRRA